MKKTLREQCIATAIRRRKTGIAGLPVVFLANEQRVIREGPHICGGRYARYFKAVPAPDDEPVQVAA